jgi:hypothetical protein
VNLVFADGSVHFVKYTVSAPTFHRLAVIDDNSPISADAY